MAAGGPVVCGFLTLGRKEFMNPGDFERTFIKAGDSEAKEGLRIEEATGRAPGPCSASTP